MTKRRFSRPGVYVEEVSFLPPQITAVQTSIVAFIGYTERSIRKNQNLHLVPTKVNSILEFESFYGKGFPSKFELVPQIPGDTNSILISGQAKSISFLENQQSFLYPSVKGFFENGGGSCYIISVRNFGGQSSLTINKSELIAGLIELEKVEEPSMVAIPDAVLLGDESFEVYQEILSHCAKERNRFSILDVPSGYQPRSILPDCISEFRDKIGLQNLSFGAAYYPWLHSNIIDENEISVSQCFDQLSLLALLPEANAQTFLNSSPTPSGDYLHQGLLTFSPTYSKLIEGVILKLNLVPPSGFIAGKFAATDKSRGVWKAPANIHLDAVHQLAVNLTNEEQEDLNIDHIAGKSINAIRSFVGKGILIWGARTLAGNDNEWKYLNVKRTFIMVEQSIKNGLQQFVFQENNSVLWTTIESVCTNFLSNLWRNGAFVGSQPRDAFYVSVGLGKTMTAQDILEKRLIVEIGMAVVRPAEFIILRVQQKMP